MRQNPESRFEYLIKESRAGRLYIIPLPAEDQRATNNNAIPQTQSIKPGQSSVHVMNVNSYELEGFHGLGQWPLLALGEKQHKQFSMREEGGGRMCSVSQCVDVQYQVLTISRSKARNVYLPCCPISQELC